MWLLPWNLSQRGRLLCVLRIDHGIVMSRPLQGTAHGAFLVADVNPKTSTHLFHEVVPRSGLGESGLAKGENVAWWRFADPVLC